MTPPGRFKRVAHDLEKLPCELHDGVLDELEFHQLIRLSLYASAGSRLHWSLRNSSSNWGVYFKEGNMAELQCLLAITDRIKRVCFRLPKMRDKEPYPFREGTLSFLQQRNMDWELNRRDPRYDRGDFSSFGAMASIWLESLNFLVLDVTWTSFHEGYDKFIEPWIATLEDGTLEVFQKVPDVGECKDHYHWWLPQDAMRKAFSVDELGRFLGLYQQLRLNRATALSAELCKLADLYERHPNLFKTPFAPQSPRTNTKHIPDNMRFEARKILKKAKDGQWSEKETSKYRFRFPFPALVPYNWATQFFSNHCSDNIASLPEEILNNRQNVLRKAPTWITTLKASLEERLETVNLSKAEGQAALCEPKVPEVGDAYLPHPEDLQWLESFSKVTATLEEQYPGGVKDVRGNGWAACK